MNEKRIDDLYKRFRTLAGEQQELIDVVHSIMGEMWHEIRNANPLIRGALEKHRRHRDRIEAKILDAYPRIYKALRDNRTRSAMWIAREVERDTGINWRRLLPVVRGVRGWWAPVRKGWPK